jgi:signal recognition particle subunit SRP54
VQDLAHLAEPELPHLGAGDLDEGAVKVTQALLDSMTRRERLDPSIINGSRRRRIARGSGTNVQQVNKLLKQYGLMRRMIRDAARGARRP